MGREGSPRGGKTGGGGKQRGLAGREKRRARQLLHGAQADGRSLSVAVNQKMRQGDIHLLALLVVCGVLGRASMGFHQHAGHAGLGAVAVGEAQVAVRAVGERLDMVAQRIQALHGLLLQVQLGLAQRSVARAADFQAVGIVLIAAVPVVGIHDQGGPQCSEQARHGARFRLGEHAPVAVEVGMDSVQARALLRAVRVDHRDNIQSDMAQVGTEGRVSALGGLRNQMEQSFRGGRLIAMLAAHNQKAHSLGRGHMGVAQAHQPERSPMHRLSRRGKSNPGRTGRLRAQLHSHLAIRRDRGRGRLHRRVADQTKQQKQRRNEAHKLISVQIVSQCTNS